VQPRAPQPPASVEDAERVLGAAVDALDAAPDLYSIGTVADGAVCLVPDDGRWAVFLADGGQRRFAGSFDDPMLAAVHFAGVLLIAAAERGALPRQAAPVQSALAAQNGQNSQNGANNQNGHGGHPDRSTDPLAEFLAGPPITPLAQDPPTTLYTDHRLTVLTPGIEVDRFGDQLGNTVYAARTRYPHRSLPPDYIEREYRVYRVRDPLRALVGTAIPWFGQPGGGTAYLLPRPIRDLLREGALVEIPSATVGPA
ncbi:MAG: TNT domain-containing protein, partial [Catenulispora sp.]